MIQLIVATLFHLDVQSWYAFPCSVCRLPIMLRRKMRYWQWFSTLHPPYWSENYYAFTLYKWIFYRRKLGNSTMRSSGKVQSSSSQEEKGKNISPIIQTMGIGMNNCRSFTLNFTQKSWEAQQITKPKSDKSKENQFRCITIEEKLCQFK